jgi:DNA repair exonuclease SbcCD nuclease subunit
MVLHVGDLTDWDTSDHVQYIRASDGFALLDQAGIPYAIAIGNHDTAAVKPGGSAADGDVKANVRITTTFNRYFPPTRFKNLTQTFQKDQSDNAVHQFSAGELDFLVLNLELWPRTHIIEWAKKIVSNNPQRNVIILTHSYLDANGNILQHNGGYGANSPQYLYDKLISQYPNIKLVFCGHAGQSLHRIDTGNNGNTITTFLQCIHDPKTNPVRLLTIDRATGSMKSSIYCPWTNEYRNDGSSTISDMKWLSKSQNELQNAETK